jgi:hypothetical protein
VVCALLLAFLAAGAWAARRRAPAAPHRLPAAWPQAPSPGLPLLRALLVAAAVAIPLALLFAFRTGPLIFLGLAVILWRGVGPRALTAVAAVLLAVVVPLVYLVSSPANRGGYNFEYSLEVIDAHWVVVAAVVLLMAACGRSIAAARTTRRPSAPPPSGLPAEPEVVDHPALDPAGAGRQA